MVRRHLRAPVEHLLPVGQVAARGRLDEESRVTGLAVAVGNTPPFLLARRKREELPEHRVRVIEEVGRDVVTREHEAGTEAAHDAVDDRAPLPVTPTLEREQVDVEQLRHDSALVACLRPLTSPAAGRHRAAC
jgi:hypothetical protein